MKTKKITRKGCRNVRLVWHEPNDWCELCEDYHVDGEWVIEKIHNDKPATYVTKTFYLAGNMLSGKVQKKRRVITCFPYNNLLEGALI